MDAVLDDLNRAFDVAFGLGVVGGGRRKLGKKPRSEFSANERSRMQSVENANYQLQVGDGIYLNSNCNKRGVIRSINGRLARVQWFLPGEARANGEITEKSLASLSYLPTLHQIYGKDPTNAQEIRDDNCITVQIQREWDDIRERQANCHPTPPTQAVATLNHNAMRIRKKITSDNSTGDQ